MESGGRTRRYLARIAQYTTRNGISAALHHFKYTGSFPNLRESTVRGWKNAYCTQLSLGSRKKEAPVEPINKLPEKQWGRPLLLGEEVEEQVKWFLKGIRQLGGAVNSQIVIATVKRVVTAKDANFLANNGGPILITKNGVKQLLGRMGLVKHQATTKAKVTPSNFEKVKQQGLVDIHFFVFIEEIPDNLIINWDQTGVKYVPVFNWTMEVKGSKRVEVPGTNDKRQITALLSCTLSGNFLPVQVSYAGKTPACLLKVEFPPSWHVRFTPNHRSIEGTMMGYLHHTLIPYVEKVRSD